MKKETEQRLLNQLIKLSDLLEDCEEGEPHHNEYMKEYTRIQKQLFK